jgi:hypothetical protein
MMARLKSFNVSSADEGYTIRIETDDGQALDLEASYEQLDLIAEAIDERLDEDEEDALEVEEAD